MTCIGMLLALALFEQASYASLKPIEILLGRLEEENSEVKFSDFELQSREQNLVAARSLLYPNLSVNTAVSKSKELTIKSSDFETQSSGGQAGTLGLPETMTRKTEGWNAQASSRYYLFAHFAIDNSIDNAKLEIESATWNRTRTTLSKRADLLQALLQWKWLYAVKAPMKDAMNVLSQVKKHTQMSNDILFNDDDRADFNEKDAELQVHQVKAFEGLRVTEAALLDLIPSLDLASLEKLPDFGIHYPIPDDQVLQFRYQERSLRRKIRNHDVTVAENNAQVARWKRPWIPAVVLSGNVENHGGYDGKNTGNSWAGQLLFSFDLFDGFYTDSRRKQANIALMGAEERRTSDASKAFLELRARRMKALVSGSEFKHKEAISQKKWNHYEDIKRRYSRGVATQLDLSVASLAYIKSRLDALESLRDHQMASLGIAVELNDWEKVQIYEIK